jgi:hypothetical protein
VPANNQKFGRAQVRLVFFATFAAFPLLVLKIWSRRRRIQGYAIMAAIASTSGEVLRARKGGFTQRCIGWSRRV